MPEVSAQQTPTGERVVRILCIDGGGIRGIIPARLLAAVEKRMGEGAANLFHLIAGTSTGGILACGLVAGKRAQELGDLYKFHGPEIFVHSWWRPIETIGGLTGPKYPAAPLENMLAATLGDTWLSEIAYAPELLVPAYCIELPKPVMIEDGRVRSSRVPYFFKSWKARNKEASGDHNPTEHDFKLRDIARATSAAPTYFPPAPIQNHANQTYWMVDGGTFANNPTMCAYASARKLYPDADRYMVVSLGTGSLERRISGTQAASWGDVGWLHPILSILMDGNADTVCYEADEVLASDHMRFDISLGSDPADDPTAVNEDFDDASPDNIARIEALAGRQIALRKDLLDRLCRELARPRWSGGGSSTASRSMV